MPKSNRGPVIFKPATLKFSKCFFSPSPTCIHLISKICAQNEEEEGWEGELKSMLFLTGPLSFLAKIMLSHNILAEQKNSLGC